MIELPTYEEGDKMLQDYLQENLNNLNEEARLVQNYLKPEKELCAQFGKVFEHHTASFHQGFILGKLMAERNMSPQLNPLKNKKFVN